jgi:hypothetical protein
MAGSAPGATSPSLTALGTSKVPSPRCEASARRINYTLAQFARTQATLGLATPSGRLSTLPAGSTASLMRAESTLIRMISITESFCFGELARHLEEKAPLPRTDLIERLYLDAEERAMSSWSQAATAFKTWTKVTLGDQGATWQNFRAIVEARNAVIHGLGSFTSRQRRDKSYTGTQKMLGKLGFDVADDRVRVTPSALRTSGPLCIDVMTWIDLELPALQTAP